MNVVLLAAAVLTAIAVHELGHASATRACGYRPLFNVRLGNFWAPRITIGFWAPTGGPPPLHDFLIALAGPTASLLLTLGTINLYRPLSIASSLVFVVTVLPFPHPSQDSTRALSALRKAVRRRRGLRRAGSLGFGAAR